MYSVNFYEREHKNAMPAATGARKPRVAVLPLIKIDTVHLHYSRCAYLSAKNRAIILVDSLNVQKNNVQNNSAGASLL